MGWYVDQAIRLLRERWQNPTLLAEELYAMLTGKEPMISNSPLELRTPPGIPPITINNPEDGAPLIQIQLPNGDKIPALLAPDAAHPDTPTPGSPTTIVTENQGSVFPGKVVDGDGDTYTVDIYPNGRSQASERVTVTQLQIDSQDTIPAGTWAIVIKNGDEYTMQVPVFL